eukprot:scaffold544824_cov39-Prasinocladus_malaysianus.AAC.1
MQPLHDVKLAVQCRLYITPPVQAAALRHQPLEEVQMPSRAGRPGGAHIPGTSAELEPLDHLKVPPHDGALRGLLVPGAPVVVEPAHQPP